MTDRLAELGALQYAVENLSTAGANPNRLGLAGYIHAAYTDYQAWAAANPGVNPNRLSARGRLYGYFYDHASWSPLSLFASSEVGAWYDPSDLTTMFQDRAGTTPVTADSQPVGLILDKSKGLVKQSLSTTGWSIVTAGDGVININGNVITITGMTTTCRVDIVSTNWVIGDYCEMEITATTTSGLIWVGGGVPDTPVVGTKIYKKLISGSTICRLQVDSGSNTFTVVSRAKTLGNHAFAPSDAARPLYKTDGTYHWLQFDGVDDRFDTASVDFSVTDSISVFSGVLKNNNTAISAVVDINGGWSNTYSAALAATITNGVAEAGFRSRGSGLSSQSVKSFDVSTKAVITGIGDISSDISKTRVNSSEGTNSSDQGSGNYGNGIIRIGASVGYYYLPGNIYSVIVRGATSTTQEITDTETWVNGKTGAY